MELAITEIDRLGDRLERLEVVDDLLFGLAVLHKNDTTENDETIVRGLPVELESLSGGGDSLDDRLTCGP